MAEVSGPEVTPPVHIGIFQQTKFLLYRNLLFKIRNRGQTLQEFLIPVYFVVILGLTGLGLKPKTDPAIPSSQLITSELLSFLPYSQLAIVPNNSQTQDVMESVYRIMGGNGTHIFYDSVESMEEAYESTNGLAFSVGIVFNADIATNFSYMLRFPYQDIPTANSPDFTGIDKCRTPANGLASYNCPANMYLYTGFTALQFVIDNALISGYTGNPEYPVPEVTVKMFPKTSWTNDLTTIQTLTGVYMVIAFMPFSAILLSNLVREKELKIKESMKIMGMKSSVFWLSWGITYLVIVFFISWLMAILLFAFQLLAKANVFLLFVAFFLYGLSVVTFAFAATTLFDRALMAGAFGGIIMLLAALVFLPLQLIPNVPVTVKWCFSLLSPIAFSFTMDAAVALEALDGVQFSNIGEGEFSFGDSLLMIFVDILIYSILALYLDAVIPAEYGLPKPFYFCFLPLYWSCGNAKRAHSAKFLSDPGESNQGYDNNDDIEPITSDLEGKEAIRIFSLVKTFNDKHTKKEVKAVNGVSLSIYEGQITCLLGHNAAGKTTLINVLTGVYPASYGRATIFGLDITDPVQMDSIRRITGVCPQQNILLDFLTPREHLKVLAGVKGVPEDQIDNEVDKILVDIDLDDQAEVLAKNLSGGQKRKLCLGLAIIGRPKLLFLDEPTSGMDPLSRRKMWKVLQGLRNEGHVIILTTHEMDEADILADRKAIMVKGQIRSCGSSLFLKNKFGIGYHLGMVVEHNCNIEGVTNYIKELVPGAELLRSHGMELAYALPLQDINLFPKLFRSLEGREEGKASASSLAIDSYGISMTTLEEVFLKLGEEAEEEEKNSHVSARYTKNDEGGQSNLILDQDADGVAIEETTEQFLDSSKYATREIDTNRPLLKTLVKFRVHLASRNGSVYVFRIIMPILYMVASVCVAAFVNIGGDTNSDPVYLPRDKYISSPSPLLYQDSLPADNDNISRILNAWDVMNVEYKETDNLTDLLQKAPHNLAADIQQLNFENSSSGISLQYQALYNDTAVHSLPILLNTMACAQLAMEAGGDDPPSISVVNQPLPVLAEPALGFNIGLLFVILFGFAFVQTPSGFATDVVKDREIKCRAQLRVSGVTINQYWGSIYIVDFALYSFGAVAGLILILAFQISSMTNAGAIICFILLIVLFMINNITFAYCISFAFNKFETCQSVLPWFFSFSVMIFGAPVIVLDLLVNPNIAAALHLVFTFLVPPYTIIGGLYYIDRIYQYKYVFGIADTIVPAEYFYLNNYVVPTLILMIVQFFLLFFFLRYLELRSMGGGDPHEVFGCSGPKSSVSSIQINMESTEDEDEDSDVHAERQKIESLGDNASNMPVLTLRGVRKEYEKKESKGKKSKKKGFKNSSENNVKVAVSNLSMGINKGEVFGLLGPNGAGKTTTLNMVTANEHSTSGRILVNGWDLSSNTSEAFKVMGYCPQIDPLWDDVTLKEHLQLYSAIKGIHPDDIDNIVLYYSQALKIDEHLNKKAKQLSGGTKRKLCFAISMLGQLRIVLMDEPSTGMDPKAKRFLWNTISNNFKDTDDKSAILTTHSMLEADAVCSRIGIMVSGKLKALGPTQHLKDKFGQDYFLEVKLTKELGHYTVQNDGDPERVEDWTQLDRLNSFITQIFPDATPIEVFGERVSYRIPKSSVSLLGEVFSSLEEGKERIGIEEYSFSQSTLEQVFLNLAKTQDEESLDAVDRQASKRYKTELQRTLSSDSKNATNNAIET